MLLQLASELALKPLVSEFEAAASQVEISLTRFEECFERLDLNKLPPTALRELVETRVALTTAALIVRNTHC